MGNTLKRITRPLRNYNIENRAHKAISKEKRPAPPTFQSVQRQIQLVNELEPKYKEIASKKHTELDDNLKRVFVTSSEGSEIDSRYNPNRPLPKDNYCREEFEYGFYEPDVNEVPEGKVTLRQAVTFIDKYMKDPTNYTADVIANEYKIDPKVTANILEYYRVFNFIKNKPIDEVTDAYAMPLTLKSGIRIKVKEAEKSGIYNEFFDLKEEDKLLNQIEDDCQKEMDRLEALIEKKKLPDNSEKHKSKQTSQIKS